MINLIRLTAVSLAARRIKQGVRRSIVQVATIGVSAVIAATGAGFCLNSLWVYVAAIHGPITAGLWIGGGLILLALLILSIAMISQSRAKALTPPPVPLSFPALTEGLTNQLTTALQANTTLPSVALVLLFGYAMGRGLRRK